MTAVPSIPSTPGFNQQTSLILLFTVAAVAAAALSLRSIAIELPVSAWWEAIVYPDPEDLQQLIVGKIVLPRVAISILAGAALALSGVIFQQMLRNPLAEPTTLGVSAGASLALKLGILFAPGLADSAQEAITLSGAALALFLSFALAWRDAASPLRLILAGLIVGLFCGVANSVISLFFHDQLRSVFLWNSGSLLNVGWSSTIYLAPRVLVCLLVALLLVRPFNVLELNDDSAKSLGVPLTIFRLVGMLLAVSLAAFTVSAVGVIGFIGIAAPALVRMAGVRTFKGKIIAAPMLGGVLLWLADQCTQINPLFPNELPAGVMTAVLGGPLMLWMLPRLRGAGGSADVRMADTSKRLYHPWSFVVLVIVALALISWVALVLGESLSGWTWTSISDPHNMLQWRWPRVIAAAAAGAMLAMSGTLIQRMTGNAMASPEILGISSGATLGVVLLFLIEPSPNHALKVGVAGLSAFMTLVTMLSMARKTAFAADGMLLTGVALGTILGAILSLLMVSSDPRLGGLLAWMSGSTYAVTPGDATVAAGVALGLLAFVPLTSRWLEVLPLGEVTARELGLHLGRSRLIILIMTAILTGAAVLIVGPLSFVGLMAPHIARMMGFQRPLSQLAGSAALGALIMVTADWVGRNILFPYQVPAGILATLIGGPYFMWLMWRRPK